MKIILSENQYARLIESTEKKIIKLPSMEFFHGDTCSAWELIKKFLESKNDPYYTISGNLILTNCDITNVGKLVKVKNLSLIESSVESLNYLQQVTGYIYTYRSKIKQLPELEFVGGDFDAQNTPLEYLPKLTYVGGDCDLVDSEIKKLDNLKIVRGSLRLTNTKIKSLGVLGEVGKSLFANHTDIRTLGNLTEVGGNLS